MSDEAQLATELKTEAAEIKADIEEAKADAKEARADGDTAKADAIEGRVAAMETKLDGVETQLGGIADSLKKLAERPFAPAPQPVKKEEAKDEKKADPEPETPKERKHRFGSRRWFGDRAYED